ncbi:putative bifunctional diguanylate cyclase/phosphodiesterase [Candidatus Solirubrobacter pratensis]|uniref:putative bifunctional diguanylate cyclase/phosphodiesterase n=1 Tax=Candidatus Solirubrobacter pratensis TaxID=1298857 RepID=UPI000688EB3C|nr:EAL domain-containing protein [Candidatus Solirubrobacter pratensis]
MAAAELAVPALGLHSAVPTRLLHAVLVFGSTGAIFLRVIRRPQDRVVWMLLGLAVALTGAGGSISGQARSAGHLPHFPSLADGLYLAYFPLVLAAGLWLAHARIGRLSAGLWLDGAIGTLGAAALVAQVLGEPVREAVGGGAPALLTLSFPLGHLLLSILVVVALALRGRPIGRAWLLLGAGFLLRVVSGTIHAWAEIANGAVSPWVRPIGILSLVAIAAAAWCPPTPPRVARLAGLRMLVTPAVVGTAALGVLVLDHFHDGGDLAVWLAAATLLVLMARVALTFRENQLLLASRHQAVTDELTGLPNRRLFNDRLRAAVEDEERLAVAMVDLDRFKELNDTLGHHAGDLLLEQLGTRLTEAVADAGLVARLGGDEFALLLPGAGLARAAEIGRRVGAALQDPFEIDGLEVVMDASIGAALFPEHGADAECLLQRADVAMYQAKQARTGFQAYDPGRDRHSRERLALMAELRRALERDELILHYQPKVELESGRVAGVEALVRWQHPVHGLRGPGAFLPHAEHTALMRPLTLHVLRTALGDLKRWRDDGLDLCVAVNLAVQNLLDLRTPAQVGELLAAHGLEPSVLTLEVTESLLLHDPQRAGEVLRDLQEMGVGLALDDFGTGYSSLEHLKRLPVHELKIDKSFVMAMDRDPADRAIVASTAALGRALGLRVVAEGVESAASASVLAAIGCDMAQGFHYSPPVQAEQIPALVRGQIGVADLARQRAAAHAARASAA